MITIILYNKLFYGDFNDWYLYYTEHVMSHHIIYIICILLSQSIALVTNILEVLEIK